MSKFHFPFDFMGKICDCDGEIFKPDIFVTFYGKRKCNIQKQPFFSNNFDSKFSNKIN